MCIRDSLITKEEESKLDYGKKIHELFELTDFCLLYTSRCV